MEAARLRQELEEGARRAEAVAAQKVIDDFMVKVRELGMAPEPLQATLMNGTTVKTDKRGWYVNNRRSLAIGEKGEYYVLVVPGGGLLTRFTGVKLEASPPSLEVSRGGRDGESGPLVEFLERVLDRARRGAS
jgi:hypothetical protein